MDKYQRELRAHVIRHVGFVLLSKLDGAALTRLWAQLAVAGRKPARPGGPATGLSAKSVENVANTVHRMLRDAVRWGRIPKSPADMADPPKRSATYRLIKAWNIDTLRTFLELTSGDDLSSLWMLLASTGLRRGEALGLRWSDIDLDNGRAHVTQAMIAIGWQVYVGQRRPTRGDDRSLSIR